MNRIHHIRRLAGVLAGLAAAMAAVLASAPDAFARPYPPPGLPVAPAVPAHTHAVVTVGMSGWQIALIAIGAAILGAIVAVLLDRARAARHHLPATAA
jgi:hypothetical protein